MQRAFVVFELGMIGKLKDSKDSNILIHTGLSNSPNVFLKNHFRIHGI